MARLVNISDVCNEIFAGGDAPKNNMSIEKTDEFSIPIYSNGEAKNGLYGYTNFARVTEPSVTISARGTIGFAAIRNEPFVPIVRLITLTPNLTLIDIRYLYYAVQNYHFDGSGTSIPQLTVPMLKQYLFPLPEIEKQIYISTILDKVNSLISLRKQQLAKLDKLIKARFVEMFGDCRVNNKGFEQLKGNELFKFSSGKFLPEEKRKGCGVPVYGGNGIAWYTDTFLIEYPTIIIGRVGAQCGNIHLVTEPVWITDNAIYIKEQKTDKFRLKFLSELMIIMNFYQYADFSGQPKITQKPLENTSYLVPPVKLQEQFSDFAGRVDQHKLTIQQSLDTLEVLKKSLMQEYFS